ncbi:DUF1279 super [Blastocladiella emersonii ATCC 22665]|nr:DUF1279 super [Blastocladiella emersonii ATCC 22665]
MPRRHFASLLTKANPSSGKPGDAPSLSGMARLRKLFKDYGRPAFAVYMAISTVDLTLSFIAVYSGVDVERVVDVAKAYLEKWGLWRFAVDEAEERELRHTIEGDDTGVADSAKPKDKSLLTTFLIAYAFHKLLLPIRVPITAAVTPGVVRYLRRWGWMKDMGAVARTMQQAAAESDKARKAAASLALAGVSLGLLGAAEDLAVREP